MEEARRLTHDTLTFTCDTRILMLLGEVCICKVGTQRLKLAEALLLTQHQLTPLIRMV